MKIQIEIFSTTRSFKYLTFFLLVKLFLDFFSPFRNLNLAVEFILAVFPLLDREYRRVILSNGFIYAFCFFFMVLIISGFNEMSIKYFVNIFFLFSCIALSYMESREQMMIICKYLIKYGLLFCFSVILLSVLLGLYSSREVYNFEHVNLFGAYISFLSLSTVLLQFLNDSEVKGMTHALSDSYIFICKLSFLAVAFFSTSTGAFLSVMILLIPIRFFNFRNLGKLSIFGLILLAILYFASLYFVPDLHNKIFGVFKVFTEVLSFDEFVDLSIRGDNIGLTSAMQAGGSFTWRIFNYIFYLNNFFSASVGNILFGSGAGCYLLFNDYYLPHNDFIFILLDFGVLGLVLFGGLMVKLTSVAVANNFFPIKYFLIIFILRLGFENILVSSYLSSLLMCITGLLIGIYKKEYSDNSYGQN